VSLAAAGVLVSGCGVLGSSGTSSATGTKAAAATRPGQVEAGIPESATPKATTAPTKAGRALAADAASVSGSGSAAVTASIVTSTTVGGKFTVGLVGKERWQPTVAGALTMTGVSVGGTSVGKATMLLNGSALYVKLPGLSSVLHKQWAKLSLTEATKAAGVDLSQFSTQAAQLQPGTYLDVLSRSASVKAVGKATVDGVSTEHYAGSVDLAKALSQLPNVPAMWTKLATAQGVKTVHVDAWIDAQHHPRKVLASFGSTTGTVTVTLHLKDYGVKVAVTPPPASQTIDLTKGLLGAL
jgi:hypothetical protein